jgi:hypothetical protein
LGLTTPEDVSHILTFLVAVVEEGGLNTVLAANVMETAERVARQFGFRRKMLRLVEEVGSSKDELVLHKIRSLVVTLYRSNPPLEEREALDRILQGIDKDVKMKYLLLKELLEFDIHVPEFTDPCLQDLLMLLNDKTLAPSVSECIILLVKLKGYSLVDLVDETGQMGVYLFPRLVRKLPNEAIALLQTLERAALEDNTERQILQYCSLYNSILGGEMQHQPLNMVLAKRGLIAHDEILCSRAFSCLCRSFHTDMPFSEGDTVYRFLVDAQIGVSSDHRQQTISSLKQLVEMHFARLYKLERTIMRDEADEIRELGELRSKESGESESKKPGELESKEVEAIIQFWRSVVTLSVESLTVLGYYNKNDLCIKTLLCITEVWREKLKKVTVESLVRRLRDIHDAIIGPLLQDDFIRRMCECVMNNSFDTVREGAAKLLRLLPVNFGAEYSEIALLPALAVQRAHLIDGASRLLGVYCDKMNNHGEMMVLLATKLQDEIAKLSTADALANSQALGLMAGLR